MTVLQKWLAGLISLGALYLVVTNSKGFATAVGAAQGFFAGTEKVALGRA